MKRYLGFIAPNYPSINLTIKKQNKFNNSMKLNIYLE